MPPATPPTSKLQITPGEFAGMTNENYYALVDKLYRESESGERTRQEVEEIIYRAMEDNPHLYEGSFPSG